MRRTKILATLGPATDKPGVLEELFRAGVDAVRLNFSHGSAQDHIDRANNVRAVSKKTGRRVGILADLQGPKIRIARFAEDKVWLDEGQDFALDINLNENDGDNTHVGITYEALANEVKEGSRLLLDDGRVVLDVVNVVNGRINCTVVVGGYLSNNKGINLLGGGLSAAALTEKDKEDIITIGKIQADFVAVSFPRCADDLHLARKLLADVDCHAGIVAKIERAEAMQKEVMDEIILASDVIMVARGDLGVEIGDANLPAAQKILISRSRELDRAVITATQMMESMIENPIPTRAEVFDVANAVLDGTDAIMLSAETAAGKYPVQTVQAMVRVCLETDKQRAARTSKHRVDTRFERTDEAIAMAAMYLANHSDIQGLVSLTESGATPLWMSRIRSGLPIFAFSGSEATLGRVTLYRGVIPIYYELKTQDHVQINRDVIELLKQFHYAEKGDTFIITKGDLTGQEGGTNALKVVTVGAGLIPE
ncbi:pyruvate kinase [Bathymodiolus japonicus methanotrophic gill symbiont]|uniref:pyruvate kinase n=1 Tax=Bathymodiolus japonicus methanotrophic gill symbiont TaxID=113269 RepID=UPI001C8DA850|nr:pyruvate kinase [Bathymodiolus japonicus methanotrophic gill symbiont]